MLARSVNNGLTLGTHVYILEHTYLLLLALARSPKEGWSIAVAIADINKRLRNERVIPIATAYLAIKTLQINGWVRVVGRNTSGPGRAKIL